MNAVLIPMILLSLAPFNQAKSLDVNDESDFMKQHRIFSRLSGNWDESEASIPDTALFEELMQQRQSRKPIGSPQSTDNYQAMEVNHYDGERELESSLPYGIQNVLDGSSARTTRSKSHLTRTTFQSLCPSKRETVFLNLESDYEYRPDHYEEVTCAHQYAVQRDFQPQNYPMPVCSEAGFSCIQLNRTLFLTRRANRAEGCWESETRLVAAGCECMWPKHHLGDIMAHH